MKQMSSGAATSAPLESPAQLAVFGVVVWIVGALFHPLAILAPVGVLLLLVAGIAYLVRPRTQTMYWRGRKIDLDGERGPVQRAYLMLFKH
jgi:hypothetical protein